MTSIVTTKAKLNYLSDAIESLMARYPGRLQADFEEDHIRLERVLGQSPISHELIEYEPMARLQMDIEVDPNLLELGQANDTAHRPKEGYMVVQYQLGDTPDKEHHIHFPTVQEVIDYLTASITTPEEREAVFH